MPSQAVALLAALMLRGPQTVAELRIGSERIHRFADISAVEGFLEELAARPAGALVVELSRQPGTRETRWTHLLSGPPAARPPRPRPRRAARTARSPSARSPRSRPTWRTCEDELRTLQATVARLCAELGIAPP